MDPGIAILVIGLIAAGLYRWTGIRSGTFKRSPRPANQPAVPQNEPAPSAQPVAPDISTYPTAPLLPSTSETQQAVAIGNILDKLLARSISHDEAVARIGQLVGNQKP